MAITGSAEVHEGSPAVLLGRITGLDGARILQADIDTITRKTFDTSTKPGTTAVDETTLTIGDAISDTLKTDARWTVDATGYNFEDTVPASVLVTGGHVYRVEYEFGAAAGSAADFTQPFIVVVKGMRGS